MSFGIPFLHLRRTGQLRLELPKQVYERTGLVGYAIPDGGRKHEKTRFGMSHFRWRRKILLSVIAAIEVDLRQSSMVRGKKGFDRLLWACKNTLTDPVAWVIHETSNLSGCKPSLHK